MNMTEVCEITLQIIVYNYKLLFQGYVQKSAKVCLLGKSL